MKESRKVKKNCQKECKIIRFKNKNKKKRECIFKTKCRKKFKNGKGE